MSAQEMKVEDLERVITYAATEYYAGTPVMSDEDFDKLIDALPDDHPIRSKVGWGGSELLSAKGKVEIKHKLLIGGLDKSKFVIEPEGQHCITHKLDGIAGVAYYDDNGELENIVTRGDGETGLRVDAENLVPTRYIPNAIVRGEIVITKASWESLEDNPYKHPRNAAAGIVNSNTRDMDYLLTFIAYTDESSLVESYFELIEDLDQGGFDVVRIQKKHVESRYDNTIQPGENFNWKQISGQHEVVVDGSVWKPVNGSESFALKYENAVKETVVIRVEWNETDRGRLQPLIHIAPVELDGATISKTSGLNARFIYENAIGAGSKVEIIRANNVIPHINKVKSIADSGVWQSPEGEWRWDGAHIRTRVRTAMEDQLKLVAGRMILQMCGKGVAQASLDNLVKLGRTPSDCTVDGSESVMSKKLEEGRVQATKYDWSSFELILHCKIDGVGRRATTSYLEGKATPRIVGLIENNELWQEVNELYKPTSLFDPKVGGPDAELYPVCITGSLDGHTKKSFCEKYLLVNVSVAKADVVIASSRTSVKAQTAIRQGKTIMTQAEFEEYMK